MEYVRGRRTNGRNREELAKLRAIAVDRTMDFFLEGEDERGLAASEEEVGQKLNEHYTEILLKESRNDPNKKRSLKGLMLQRIKEMMEQRGWRIVTLSSNSLCSREVAQEAEEKSLVPACPCRARMGEMAEDIALSKQMILRLTTRIEDLEKKLEEKLTIAKFKEHSSGEETANAVDEAMIPIRPHLIQATQPSSPSTKGRKQRKEEQDRYRNDEAIPEAGEVLLTRDTYKKQSQGSKRVKEKTQDEQRKKITQRRRMPMET